MRRTRGFTLVELLVVIAIIGVLAAITIVSIIGAQRKARDTQVKSKLGSVGSAISQYEVDRQTYPIYAENNATNLGGVALTTLTTDLVSNYLRAASALDFGTYRARYLSSIDGKKYAMAAELQNPGESVITAGNGVYAITTHTATAQDTSVSIGGQRLSALRFDGGQNIDAGTPGAANVSGDPARLTISLWMRNPVIPTNNRRYLVSMVGYGSGGANGYGLAYQYGQLLPNNHNLLFIWGSAQTSTNQTVASSPFTSPSMTDWVHVAFVKNGGSHTFYLNGVQLGSQVAGLADIAPSNRVLEIGSEMQDGTPPQPQARRYSGDLDDVKIFNTNLSAAEIAALYNGGIGQFSTKSHPNLVIGFRLNEGQGSMIYDYKTGTTTGAINSELGYNYSWIDGVSPSGLADMCSTNPCLNGVNSRAIVNYGPQ